MGKDRPGDNILYLDFKNKKWAEPNMNDMADTPTEPSSEKGNTVAITRNFPMDYFKFKGIMGLEYGEDIDVDLSYTHDKFGKFYLTKGVNLDKEGQLFLGGILYPTECKTPQEFVELQERSIYISSCLNDASSLGYVLNAQDVQILIYCVLTPTIQFFMNKTDGKLDMLSAMVQAQAQVLYMAGLLSPDPRSNVKRDYDGDKDNHKDS